MAATELEEEEEEDLAQIPAEARLLHLLLNDPGLVKPADVSFPNSVSAQR